MVIVPKWRMELIVNDLYKLDYLDSLHKLNEVRIGMLNRQLVDADAIIKHQEDVIANNRQIQELQVAQRNSLKSESDYWQESYKKQKRKTVLIGGIGVGLLAIIILTK